MVHCVGGCYRGRFRNLDPYQLEAARCDHCGSDRLAIWQNRKCIYAYSGKVDYPMGDTKFGTQVPGPEMRRRNRRELGSNDEASRTNRQSRGDHGRHDAATG